MKLHKSQRAESADQIDYDLRRNNYLNKNKILHQKDYTTKMRQTQVM